MFASGYLSGLVAQGELTRLLDEIYDDPTLLEQLYGDYDLASLDEAGEKARAAALYGEVASVFG